MSDLTIVLNSETIEEFFDGDNSDVLDKARDIWDDHHSFQYGCHCIDYDGFLQLIEEGHITVINKEGE